MSRPIFNLDEYISIDVFDELENTNSPVTATNNITASTDSISYNYDNIFSDIDIIIPVPLHQKKLNKRGFNQSEWFAKGLSIVFGKSIDTGKLFRIKETETQTRKKKYERWENVEGIFELKDEIGFEKKHVLLVDDVITTGSTIDAAFQPFKGISGIRISHATIAFARQM
mgnify:CR=1 FL=1